VAALVLVLWAVETLQSARWLGPLICGAAIAYALVTAAGCASPMPRDPRDPDVWRPTTPAVYPLPR
jgi:hypothetical protein